MTDISHLVPIDVFVTFVLVAAIAATVYRADKR